MSIPLSNIEGFIYRIEYDFIQKIIPYYFGQQERLEIVEIGSYKGKSTLMFLQSHPNVSITCIEPFCGPTDADATHLYRKPFKEVFLQNTREYQDRITVIDKFSNDQTLHTNLDHRQFDICFIDGDHSYASVVNDIDLCLAHLKMNGLLILDDYWIDCGDTFKFRGVRDAVNEKLLYEYKFLFVIRSMIIFQHDREYRNYEL